MTTDKATPMLAEDGAEYFKSCADAFSCLATIINAIQDSEDKATTECLIVAGRHVANRFSELANIWRDELKAGGFDDSP